ncbi:MAG: FtsX-like permease family protein [Faecalibacterium sp.]|nr:FtsX-like permease family protein [Ruminococcus sp.]MCM1391340.1 FtsX-like permease family protein [Ruminococcus sp.]MCM1484899.1 FtsX-like permease family protein [Faecalibacterium sp.]
MKKKKKLTVSKLAFGNIKMHKRQYTLLIISIILAMIFSTGTVFFVSCMRTSREQLQYESYGEQTDVMISPEDFDFESGVKKGYIDAMPGYMNIISFAYSKEKGESRGFAVCSMDETAKQLYHVIVTEGRYPEKAGEIAIEARALARLGTKTELGEKITLQAKPANGERFMNESTEKTYTLVGILQDKKGQMGYSYEDGDYMEINPCAVVSGEEKVELGGKNMVLAFYKLSDFKAREILYGKRLDVLYTDQEKPDYDMTIWNKIVQYKARNEYYQETFEGTAVNSQVSVATALVIVLAVTSCIGIVNAFSTNLNERKKQIGLLRAVGTTKRQIINIFGREAFVLCLICTPISILVSYLGVWIYAHLMGDRFIFAPNVKILFIGAVIGIICVMLAALIPLIHITKISPMQAIRNTELARKMRKNHVRSQKQFNPSWLLAKRSLSFSKARQIGTCIFLVITIVISGLSMSIFLGNDYLEIYKHDYIVSNPYDGIEFVNYADNESPFTESLRQEILSIPYVASAELEGRNINVNMLVEGDYPLYLKMDTYDYRTIFDNPYHVEENDQNNADVIFSNEYTEEYLKLKKKAGYTQDIYNRQLCSYSESELEKLNEKVTDGKINIDKINSGEEIIVDAPEEIGFYARFNKDNYLYTYSTWNMDKGSDDYKRNRTRYNQIIATAKSPFNAGDTITLSVLVEQNGKLTRTDKQVKIGAVISSGAHETYFITSARGIEKFPYQGNYESITADLSQECTFEIDDSVQSSLESIIDLNEYTLHSKFESEWLSDSITLSNAIEFISIIALLICISIGLVNNGISAQVHESKKKIGTLRAVGASLKDLTRSFTMQVMTTLGISTAIGFVIYIAVFLFLKYLTLETPVFTPLPIIVCLLIYTVTFINLRYNIKKMMKFSIVENIREL